MLGTISYIIAIFILYGWIEPVGFTGFIGTCIIAAPVGAFIYYILATLFIALVARVK